jgi:hypothetical protein
MPVPYVFGNATTSIPLSQLDANFNTVATLGNASIGLGNTTTTVGNLTLTNVTLSSGTSNMTLGNTAVTIGSATTSVGNLALTNVTITTIQEPSNVTATADLLNNAVLYLTSNATGNFTVNFRGTSATSLNNVMSNNTSVSCTVLATQGNTAYYNSALQVDGSSVTPKWQGGSAPTSGNASGIDSYTYVIIKTGSAAFTVLAAQTKFA